MVCIQVNGRMKSSSVVGCYAFTLIELLVVISIIALLIAMLTPGLEKARISARTVQCQGSLRELNVGTYAYSTEHDGYMPLPYYLNGQYNWSDQGVVGVMNFDLEYRPNGTTKGFPSEFWCPEESRNVPRTPVVAHAGFLWSRPSTRTYGMNDFGAANSCAPHIRKYEEFKYPSSIYMYTDTTPSSPYHTKAVSALYWPLHFGGRDDEPTFYVDYRHDRLVNMAYVDGHVDVPQLESGVGMTGEANLPLATEDHKVVPWGNLGFNPLGSDNFGGDEWIGPRE